MPCVVASGLYCARVPSACCQATISRTFSLVAGMPRRGGKAFAHCSGFLVAAPAGVVDVAVVPDDDWSCESSAEKSLLPELPALPSLTPMPTGGDAKRDWIAAMRA